MNCQQARQLFSPWLDGELTDEERRAFEEHLAACRACAVELEKLQAVAAAMRKMRVPVAPPEGFAALVAERLRRELAAAASAGAGEGAGSGAEVERPAGATAVAKMPAGAPGAVAAAGDGGAKAGAKVVPLAGRVRSGQKGQAAPEVGAAAAGATGSGATGGGMAASGAGPEAAGGDASRRAAAGGVDPEAAVAGGAGKAQAGKAAGGRQAFARWQQGLRIWPQGLRTGWRKSAAVAAALLMLLGGSAALAGRYLGGPGIFRPAVVAEQSPSPSIDAEQKANVDRGAVKPGDDTQIAPGTGEAPGTAGDGLAPGDGAGRDNPTASPGSPGAPGAANGERPLIAGNSSGAPGAGSPGQPAGNSNGEAGASGGEKGREITDAGSAAVQPKVFLNHPRAVESMQIRVQVRDLDAAASQLKALAQAKSVDYSVDHKAWTAEGKAVDIFRLPLPREQVEQFIGYVSALGQVIERSPRQVRDISNEFTELLNSYHDLLEERKTASGAHAQKLDAAIKQKEEELTAKDREAREQVVVMVWLVEQ